MGKKFIRHGLVLRGGFETQYRGKCQPLEILLFGLHVGRIDRWVGHGV